MSLAKINNFANDDTNILAVQTTVDALYQNSYSLTEYDSTTVPAIAAGSKIEVNGSLYRAATEEAISTTDPVTSATVANGTVYICMIPSVDASTCTAAFTATAPTWSDSKQGWYGTGGQANYKYIGGCYKSSTSYYGKYYIDKIKYVQTLPSRCYEINSTEFTTTNTSGVDVTPGFSSGLTVSAGDIVEIFYTAEIKATTTAAYVNLYFTGTCDANIENTLNFLSTSPSRTSFYLSTTVYKYRFQYERYYITSAGLMTFKFQLRAVSGETAYIRNIHRPRIMRSGLRLSSSPGFVARHIRGFE